MSLPTSTSYSDPGGIFANPEAFTDLAAWHQTAAMLRRDDPVHRVEIDGWMPFWALTRHEDIWNVERQPQRFLNTPRSVLLPNEFYDQQEALGLQVKAIVHMDGAEHTAYRLVANDWFKPANLRKTVEERIRTLSRFFVDQMMEAPGSRCDFARTTGLHFPLRIIMTAFGVPEKDEPLMLDLTQRIFGNADAEFNGGDFFGSLLQTFSTFHDYFHNLTDSRRSSPRDDIATVFANAMISGQPIGDLERFSYYLIVATAGHDTTSNALNVGMEMLARHPDQLRYLQENPAAIDNAVEEMLRYSTPARHFLRHATEDCEIRGRTIHAGDVVLMSYLSANRDEDRFEDSLRFDVTRPNASEYLTFGTGVHFCLGAHLARMEMRHFFREWISRVDELELDGEPTQLVSNFVGGLKKLPIRYQVRPATH